MRYLSLPWLVAYMIVLAFVMLALQRFTQSAFFAMLAVFGFFEIKLRHSDEHKAQRNRDRIERSKGKPNVAGNSVPK